MVMTKQATIFVLALSLLYLSTTGSSGQSGQPSTKKVYMSYILHGNMNYDRYVKSKIWKEFPVIYDNLLGFIEDHPGFKGQLQLSGQTYNSLKQSAPHVIDHAMKLYNRGQINFTGTFYSEPVNVSMDGETNLRCAQLGTRIIASKTGSTDGFYLQERAYHPQLPWILNESDVSWVPVITGDDSYFPFKLTGMDGSSTICVPNISRSAFPDILDRVPEGSLLTVEEDYEIPQSFEHIFNLVNEYMEQNKHIEVEWITVKEYIEKFGVKEEKYIDHTAVSKHINHGTYSRWTADPLDIIVQDYTNQAMADFRAANMMNSLSRYLFQTNLDSPMKGSKIELKHDPLVWDIASTDDYPDVEENYLQKDGEITLLSKIEHLLVWAVNSDSRGWYPLYEKRRERINSLENCSALSKNIVNRGLDLISSSVRIEGFDRYFILFNTRPSRNKIVQMETTHPYDVFDAEGKKLSSTVVSQGDKYMISFEATLPAYGYAVIGLKQSESIDEIEWGPGSSIEYGAMKVVAVNDEIVFTSRGKEIVLSMDDFMIKPLAEIMRGDSIKGWRKSEPYGGSRVSVREGLYPQLRVEKQIDWLVHMHQIFTLLPDRILCEVDFTFPHPTLVRDTDSYKSNFDMFQPGGLKLQFNSARPGKAYYNIPFGTSPHLLEDQSYFCTLHSGIFQHNEGGGFMITMGTGEQAFFTTPSTGEMGVFIGASTASGPIKNVGMDIVSDVEVVHEPAWYAEPFHGTYEHRFMLFPFEEGWQENHAISTARSFTEPLYMREFTPATSASMESCKSLIEIENKGIDITSMEYLDYSMNVRLNDKENLETSVEISIGQKRKRVRVPQSGIVNVKF